MASATPPANAPQQEEVDINLNDPQVGEAAKKIQNVFRRNGLIRKQVQRTAKKCKATKTLLVYLQDEETQETGNKTRNQLQLTAVNRQSMPKDE
ncbi:hypothetical protein NECAME_08692 [Necator americanus]|uniref:Uncharacterized protein n=1 Tax=Necator americanus TaxID=51031 RepID=W2TJL6_NECAM|nr:hypothetical protein NECAME_08692 [Necator americanus]ETN81212.1 hypothetical protein NECAME_08692 [Necator americanus]